MQRSVGAPNRARILLTVLCGMAVMSQGCFAEPVTATDVVGSYKLNRGSAKDEIEVLAGGRYVHNYATKDRSVSDTSTWSMGDYGGTRILFEQFRAWSGSEWSGNPNYGSTIMTGEPAPALYPALVRRSLSGEVQLVVNEDQDWKYVKSDKQH